MANNIVKFPGEWKGELPPPNYNELMEERQANLETYCVEQGVNLSYDLFYELQQLGFNLQKDKEIKKDMLLVQEAIKAIMYRTYGVEHPLHKVSQEIVNEEDAKNFAAPLYE